MNTPIANNLRPILSMLFVAFYFKFVLNGLLDSILAPTHEGNGLSFLMQILFLIVLTISSAIGYWISNKINNYNSLLIARINSILFGAANMLVILLYDSATVIAFICFIFCYILGMIEIEKGQYAEQSTINKNSTGDNLYLQLMQQLKENKIVKTIISTLIIGIGGAVIGYHLSMIFLTGALVRDFSFFGSDPSDGFFTIFKVGILVALPMIALANVLKEEISPNHIKIVLAVLLTFIFFMGPGSIYIMIAYDQMFLYILINILIILYFINLFWGIKNIMPKHKELPTP